MTETASSCSDSIVVMLMGMGFERQVCETAVAESIARHRNDVAPSTSELLLDTSLAWILARQYYTPGDTYIGNDAMSCEF